MVEPCLGTGNVHFETCFEQPEVGIKRIECFGGITDWHEDSWHRQDLVF
jgi:hypothetical protein